MKLSSKLIKKIPNSKRLAFVFWVFITFIVSLLASLSTVTYWILTKNKTEYWDWNAVQFYSSTTLILPFGMLISLIMPWGWLNLIGLILVLVLKKLWPYIFAIIGSIIIGIYWPGWLVSMVSI